MEFRIETVYEKPDFRGLVHAVKARQKKDKPVRRVLGLVLRIAAYGVFVFYLLTVLLMFATGHSDTGGSMAVSGLPLLVIFLAVLLFRSGRFVAGLSWKIIFGAAGAAAVSVPIVWTYILSDFHRNRILSVFNPQAQELEDFTFQQLEGLDSLGSGQIFGIGLFAENHNYVPEMYNDFIFTFVGESLGFLGCVAVVVALAVICGRILWTGAVSRSYIGKYICTGVFAMLAFQIIVNLGMCLMVLPVIGVTLPFLSYGGTSVLSVYISLGLVMMVYGANKKNMFGG